MFNIGETVCVTKRYLFEELFVFGVIEEIKHLTSGNVYKINPTHIIGEEFLESKATLSFITAKKSEIMSMDEAKNLIDKELRIAQNRQNAMNKIMEELCQPSL